MIGQNAVGDIESSAAASVWKNPCVSIGLRFLLGILLFVGLIGTVRYTDELYLLEKVKKNDESDKSLIPQPIVTSTEREGLLLSVGGLGNGNTNANGGTSSDVKEITAARTSDGSGGADTTTVIESLVLETSTSTAKLMELDLDRLEEIRADGRDEQGRCRQENGKLCASNTNNVASTRRRNTPDERTSPETPTTTKLLDNSKNRRKRWLGIRMLLA